MPGGSRRLDIIYHIDTQQAEAAADGFVQRQSAREKSTLTEAERLEQARERLIERAVQKRITELAKGQDAEEKAIVRVLGKEEVAQRAKENLLNQLNAKRIQVATAELAESDKMHRIHMSSLDQRMAKLGDQNKLLGDGTIAIAKFGAAMLGLQSAQQIVSTFVAHFDKIREDAFKATEDVMRMRGAVRELQALRGEMGQTGKGVSHVFDIARQTLQSTEDVQAMEQEGLGTGELAIKDDADKAEFAKAMVAAGRMQTVFGGSAAPYGKMMGQIALQSKGPLDAANMEGQANRLFQIQQPGGFRNMESALKQYSSLNPLVMNGVYTPEEAMGLASAFSVSSPEEAGTKAEQFTRSVMAGRVRSRGMSVGEGVDMERTDAYFKELGIDEQDSAIQRGKKIADDLARQKAAAEANGKRFNTTEYLMLHGFTNQQDALAIMDFAGLRNSGRLEKIEEAQNAALDPGAITRRFNERVKADNSLKDRQAELLSETAGAGQGLEEEPLVIAQKAAFGRLKAQGKITGTFKEWRNKGFLERTTQDILFGGLNEQVNRETYKSLFSESSRLGIADRPYSSFGATEGEMRTMAQRVQGAGGDITRGTAEALDKAANKLLNATEKLEEAMNPPGPPAALVGAGAAIYATRVQ